MTGRTWLTDEGRIDDRVPDQVGRTHCAELWFAGDRVYMRKTPVALGFVDFSTLDADGRVRRPGRLVVGGRSPGGRRRRRGADAQRAVAAALRRRP